MLSRSDIIPYVKIVLTNGSIHEYQDVASVIYGRRFVEIRPADPKAVDGLTSIDIRRKSILTLRKYSEKPKPEPPF